MFKIVDLRIVKGDTFPYIFVWRQRDGTPVKLTGCKVTCIVKSATNSANVLEEWTTDNFKVKLDPLIGLIKIDLSPEVTSGYSWNSGTYSVVITFPDGWTKTLVSGKVLVIPRS